MSSDPAVIETCKKVAADLSGIGVEDIAPDATFLSLGFDSLFLTQLAAAYSREFGTKVTFRQLIGETPTITQLAAILPAPQKAPEAPAPVAAPTPAPAPSEATRAVTPSAPPAAMPPMSASDRDGLAGVFAEQLRLMQEQLRMLTGAAPEMAPAQPTAQPVEAAPVAEAPMETGTPVAPTAEASEKISLPAGFGPGGAGGEEELTPSQDAHLRRLTARFNAKTQGSKDLVQLDRAHHADPRTAAGFDKRWKEVVYPLVIEKSDGAYLWDVDGNKYIDLLNGFGPNFFGHNAAFVRDALRAQLDSGFELGPQTPRAGEAAKLLCELTGMDRASWVNTGSEAVQAAIRLSRTVTSKNKIVVFEGSYHGNFDEVLVRRTGEGIGRTLPLAPGIPFESVGNVIVLKYDEDETLDLIKEHADDIAAVLVEPIQSRRPELQPREFLHALRKLTRDEEIVLVFDEVITGFRTGPGGAQAHFGIEADLATYGKVLGGGMPIGAVAGRKGVMDTFDGGFWQYGDDSIPTAGVTFFAGTFVRHPLAIAAAHASLSFLKAQGPALQTENNRKAGRIEEGLNSLFETHGVPFELARFGSQMFLRTAKGGPLASLFFIHMRDRGVHMLEGFPTYMTIAHTDEDVDHVLAAAEDSLNEMIADGMLAGTSDPDWERSYTPTAAQVEIWVASQLDEAANLAFNESDTFVFEKVDPARLEKAVNDSLNRVEAFRTRFSDDGSLAVVDPQLELSVRVLDHRDIADEARDTERAKVLEEEAQTPFDLATAPLIRATMILEAEDRAVLVLYAHHIVFDGWSAERLLDDIAAAYRGENRDEEVPFSVYAAEAGAQNDLDWWADAFATPPETLLSWKDLPELASDSSEAATVSAGVPADLAASVGETAAGLSVSPSTLWLSVYGLLISRMTGQQDFLVGLPAAGQALYGVEAIGCGAQLLPVRLRIDPEQSFPDFARGVQTAIADAAAHPSVSLGELARTLHARTEVGRPPLIQAVFNYRAPFTGVEMDGVHVTAMENPRRYLFRELFLNVTDSGDECIYDAEYRTSVFDEAAVEDLLGELTDLLGDVLATPEMWLTDLLTESPSDEEETDLQQEDEVQTEEENRAVANGGAANANSSMPLTVEPPATGPTVTESLERLAKAAAAELESGAEADTPVTDEVEPVARQEVSLSSPQERMWSHEALHPDLPIYILSAVWRLEGEIDPDRMAEAFEAVASRRDVFSARFVEKDGVPVQQFGHETAGLRQHDISDRAFQENELEELTREICFAPIDPGAESPVRAALVKLADDDYRLLMGVHHLVWDETSFDLFLHDLAAAYGGELGQTAPSFADAVTQDLFDDEGALEWWRERLGTAPAPIALPTDLPRPAVFDQKGAVAGLAISPELHAQIAEMASELDVTTRTAYLAAFAAFLSRIDGADHRLIGTPEDLRRSALRGTMGCLSDIALLHDTTTGDQNFAEAVMRLSAHMKEAEGHKVPFGSLISELDLGGDPSRPAGAQVMAVYHAAGNGARHLGDAALSRQAAYPETVTAELILEVTETGEGVEAAFRYASSLFSQGQMTALSDSFTAFLSSLVDAPDVALREVPMVPASMKAAYRDLNDTKAPLGHGTILDLIIAQADIDPQRTAMIFRGEIVAYDALVERARSLAHGLAAEGVGPGDVVGISLERTPDLVTSVLAVWFVGAAYLPLDPEHPADRLAMMREDAGAMLVIGSGEDAIAPEVLADNDASASLSPAIQYSVAYVMYTSGSTGRPKGIVNGHRQVTNFLLSMAERPGFSAEDSLLAITTLSFDISILELFLPLIAGGTVILADNDESIDGIELCRLIETYTPTMLQATPAAWRMLIDSGWEASPDLVALCGGEALSSDLAEAIKPRVAEFWNMYGPTETTVWSTCAQITDPQRVTIGMPIHNTSVFIVNEAGQLCPPGLPGELWIGGEGVAIGYHGREELTAERFLEDPFASDRPSRVYRTGDLARLTAEGDLVHMGRLDTQLKLRGFRIEPGEIETALVAHDDVSEAVVTVRDDASGEPCLVAYFTVDGDYPPTGSELRRWLRKRVPPYMLPQVFMELDALPLTPNGKVDRRALPAPAAKTSVEAEHVPPSTEKEKALAEIWTEMLGVETVSVNDNFFELGGQSLQAARAASLFRARTGERIQARAFIFETLEQLAAGAKAAS